MTISSQYSTDRGWTIWVKEMVSSFNKYSIYNSDNAKITVLKYSYIIYNVMFLSALARSPNAEAQGVHNEGQIHVTSHSKRKKEKSTAPITSMGLNIRCSAIQKFRWTQWQEKIWQWPNQLTHSTTAFHFHQQVSLYNSTHELQVCRYGMYLD